MEQTRVLVLYVRLRCGSLSITAPVLLLANELDVRSGRVNFAAVNQIHVFHKQKSQDSLKACLKMLILNIII